MIDRDILLFLTGGVVGAASAMLALLTTYWLEGMRLHRQWRREDLLRLHEKQAELNDILNKLSQQPEEPESIDDV